MTYRPEHLPHGGDEWTKLSRNMLWRWSDALQAKAKFGPAASSIQRDPALRDYVKGIKFSETTQGDASAIGSLGTFWVLDPSDPDVGIWGANIVSQDDLIAAQNGGYPMVSGFYMKIASIPPPSVMRDIYKRPGWFQDGFVQDYQDYYEPKAPPPVAATPRVFPPAYELSVNDNQIWVAKTAEESAAADDANPHPGVSYAGAGMWEKWVSTTESPSASGLPRPLIAFDSSTGTAGKARTEFDSVKAAAEKGDQGAQQALDYLGLKYNKPPGGFGGFPF